MSDFRQTNAAGARHHLPHGLPRTARRRPAGLATASTRRSASCCSSATGGSLTAAAHVDRRRTRPRRRPRAGRVRRRRAQLDAYFAGERTDFELAARAQRHAASSWEVWQALHRDPVRRDARYGELAKRDRQARRGARRRPANGRNPIAMIVPCHRVIGADGSLDRLRRRPATASGACSSSRPGGSAPYSRRGV